MNIVSENTPNDSIRNADKLIVTLKHDNQACIEIEKKYLLKCPLVFEKVLSKIKDLKQYGVDDSYMSKEQRDYYYDTVDNLLFNTGKMLRIRKKGTQILLTIKTPIEDCASDADQSERFEYEIPITCFDLNLNKAFILEHLPELAEKFEELAIALIIKNQRRKIQLSGGDILFEVVFDDITYENKNYEREYEIEIELKSALIHHKKLKALSDYLEAEVPELQALTKSKYKRGLELKQ